METIGLVSTRRRLLAKLTWSTFFKTPIFSNPLPSFFECHQIFHPGGPGTPTPEEDAEAEEEAREKENEKKRRREEKEQMDDDFQHEKFKFRENEILQVWLHVPLFSIWRIVYMHPNVSFPPRIAVFPFPRRSEQGEKNLLLPSGISPTACDGAVSSMIFRLSIWLTWTSA